VGIDVGEKTVRDISQAIAAHIEPKIYPEISTERLEGAQCIRVRFSGTEIPYSAYGRAYMRVADEDRQLSKQEQENLILRNKRSAMRWDNEPCKASLDDLDEEKVKTFVERSGLPWDSLPNTLEKLDLLVDDKLVNTAPLFFAKKPFTCLRCAVFGTTSTSFIIDRQDFDGDILTLIEEAQKYVLKNIHIGMRLEGLYRVDVPEIALPALREAIINTFCHRDYRDPQEVQVAVFKDRVEIRNPGTLFGGLTLETLRSGKLVRRRNPLVVQMLTRIQMVEAWGRGMSLILENEPDASFEEVAGIFITTFTRRAASMPPVDSETKIEMTGDLSVGETPSPASLEKRPEKKPEKTPEKIYRLLQDRVDITIAEIAASLSLNPRTVERHLAALRKAGRIRRIGADKGGTWEVLQPNAGSRNRDLNDRSA
jgi:ATP-dependent DNA helicase RecG